MSSSKSAGVANEVAGPVEAIQAPVSSVGSVRIRKAAIADVPRMTAMINGYAAQGIMLPRSQHQLFQSLRDFAVAVHMSEDGQTEEVIGCGALNIVWADLCEVRSLAVREDWVGRRVGQMLVEHLLQEARELGLPRVFALTYRQHFFERLGFHQVPHEALPHKIWGDCLNCPKYPNCDEIAVMRALSPLDGVEGNDPQSRQENLP